jgi:hypothetical protein
MNEGQFLLSADEIVAKASPRLRRKLAAFLHDERWQTPDDIDAGDVMGRVRYELLCILDTLPGPPAEFFFDLDGWIAILRTELSELRERHQLRQVRPNEVTFRLLTLLTELRERLAKIPDEQRGDGLWLYMHNLDDITDESRIKPYHYYQKDGKA